MKGKEPVILPEINLPQNSSGHCPVGSTFGIDESVSEAIGIAFLCNLDLMQRRGRFRRVGLPLGRYLGVVHCGCDCLGNVQEFDNDSDIDHPSQSGLKEKCQSYSQ